MTNASGNRLARGASIAAGGMVFQQFVSFLSGLIVARVIGAAEYGVFNLARNLVQIATIVTRLGLDLGLQRFLGAAVSVDDVARWKSRLLSLRILAATVSLLPCIAVGLGVGDLLEAQVYRYDNFALVLTVVSLSLPFLTDLGILGGAYRGIKQLGPSVMAEFVLLPVLRLAITVALFAFGWRLWAAVVGSSVAASIASVYLAIQARKDLPCREAPSVTTLLACGNILRVSAVLAAAMLVTMLTRSVDMLFLGHYATAAETGQYALAQMMLMIISLFGNAFGQSLGPLVAERYGAGDLQGMGSLLRTNSRWVALVACPIYAVFLTWGHELGLLFGPTFQIPQAVMGWLGACTLLITIVASNGYALSMTGRHGGEFLLLLIGLVLAVACCAWAVPLWGQVGAAGSAFVAIALVNALRVHRVWSLFRVKTLDLLVIPIVLLNVCLALAIDRLLQPLIETALIRVPLGGGLFAAIAFAGSWHLALNASERTLLWEQFRQLRRRAG